MTHCAACLLLAALTPTSPAFLAHKFPQYLLENVGGVKIHCGFGLLWLMPWNVGMKSWTGAASNLR